MFDMLTENRFRTRPVNRSCVWIMLFVFSIALVASAQTTQAQTTTFTFQGRLTDAGAPANGAHDFEFKLYDAAGTQVGATLTRDDVVVTDGVFSVELDFGASPFVSTTAITLEIGVRPGASTGAFTTLVPRQPITSSPYAIKTLSAAQLGGVAAGQYVQTNDSRLSDERQPAPGNSNYIQSNPAGQQAGASFNISGNGVIGGNVGIGTTSPAFTLDVKGEDIFGNTTARIHSSRQAAILSLDSTIGGQNQIWNVESGVLGNPGLFGILNRNTLQAQLTIDPSGNVGIGTTSPAFKLDLKGEDVFGNTTARIHSSRQAAILSLDSTIGGQNQIWNVESGVLGVPGMFGILNRNTLQARLTIDPSGQVSIPGNLDVGQTLSANTLSLNIVNANTQFNIGGQSVLRATGSGLGNTLLGLEAGTSISTGTDNAFVGFRAGLLNSQGSSNSFFGSESGAFNTTGSGNTFAGTASGKFNGAGSNNSFYGIRAGLSNTTGNNNTFVGVDAGQSNGGGSANSFFGLFAGANNTTGVTNSFFGVNAGFGNTTGGFNSFFGAGAGSRNTTGEANTFVGIGAGQVNTIGSDNAFFGNNAGVDNLSGSNITLVGAGSNVGSDNLTNATAIGAGAIVSASNSLVLGNNANVGIGTSVPGSKLTVVGLVESTTGGVKFPDGTVQTTAAVAGSITDITAGAGLTGGGSTGNLTFDVGAGAGINVAADTISIANLGVTTTKLANAAVTSPKIAASQVVKSLTVGANTLRDDLTLAAGSGITLTPAGNTVTIAATGGGGGPPGPGSPNYIQNTTTTQTGANFNISGSGTVGGTLSATNVGIGTTIPQTKLHVEGAGFVESTVRSTNERAILSLDSSVQGGRRIWTLESGVLGFPRWFGIYDRTAAQPRLMIAPNGNVGIGTGTPLLFSKLTVNGNILALGNVNALAVNAADIVAGNLTVQALGPAGNRPLCLNSRNLIASCTASSLRYKTDLQPFFDGLKFINQLRPISFKWKSDAALDVGFGAEDVARVNPLFATYNDKGEVEGVKYDRLSVVFVNAIKEQQAQIERQQQQIDELKKLVCHAYPAAEVCKN